MPTKSMTSFKAAGWIALYFVAVLNLALWRFVWQKTSVEGPSSLLFLLALPLCLLLLTYAVMNLLLWPYVGKAVVAALLAPRRSPITTCTTSTFSSTSP